MDPHAAPLSVVEVGRRGEQIGLRLLPPAQRRKKQEEALQRFAEAHRQLGLAQGYQQGWRPAVAAMAARLGSLEPPQAS